MRAAVLLGLRLAIGTGGQRARSVMTVVASAVGTTVLLLVWGIAHSQVGTTTAYNSSEVTLLMAGTIGMVGLPVLSSSPPSPDCRRGSETVGCRACGCLG